MDSQSLKINKIYIYMKRAVKLEMSSFTALLPIRLIIY